MKKGLFFVIGCLVGCVFSIFICLYIADDYISQFINGELTSLEKTSNEAFFNLEPKLSIFIQLYNIDSSIIPGPYFFSTYKTQQRLRSKFYTRICINYEDQNNFKIAKKWCDLAADTLADWNMNIDFNTYKQQIFEERKQYKMKYESNNQLQPSDKVGD